MWAFLCQSSLSKNQEEYKQTYFDDHRCGCNENPPDVTQLKMFMDKLMFY